MIRRLSIWGNSHEEYLVHSEKAWCLNVMGEKSTEEMSEEEAEWQGQGGEEAGVGLWAMLRR